jgi:hypothetical protein
METVIHEIPWRHALTDSFLSNSEYDVVVDYVKTLLSFLPVTEGYKEFLDDSCNTEISNILCPKVYQLRDTLFDTLNFGGKVLPQVQYSNCELVISPAGYRYGTIHEEGKRKLMTSVLYLYPQEGDGTEIYKTNNKDSYFTTIPWKPDRLLSFVGQRNPVYQRTWHDYGNSKSFHRVTINMILSENNHGNKRTRQ